MNRRQAGFTLIEGALIIAVLAIVAGVGYMAYTNLLTAPKTPEAAVATVSPSPTPIAVEKKADLSKAISALDTISLDDADSSQLNAASNSF